MPNPASSYQTIVGMQPTPNLALTGNQQSNMGNQMQGMMVQYPPVQSYQVTMKRDRKRPELQNKSAEVDLSLVSLQQVSVPQQTYQQPVFVSCQPGQAAVAVAGVQPCYSLLPPNQHTTMRYARRFTCTPISVSSLL